MRLYEEIFKDTDGIAACRCVVVPDGGGYFEGVKAVEDFTAERVVARFSHWQVAVEGESLSIKKYYDGDLELSGRIRAFYVWRDGETPPRSVENKEGEGK